VRIGEQADSGHGEGATNQLRRNPEPAQGTLVSEVRSETEAPSFLRFLGELSILLQALVWAVYRPPTPLT